MAVIVDTIKETLGGKKYLLVLDDMWNKKVDAWERLKSHLIFGAQGSKIIVTTRSDEVASVIRGMIPPYNLKKLSEDECWLIIKQRAFASGGAAAETPNVVAIGREIGKKCGGVPLAAKSLGSLLYYQKADHQWLHIKDDKIWGLFKENQVLSALNLSYINLPSHLKQCFSYCSIFPKDSIIEKQRLIQLWMAEGFLHRFDEGISNKEIEEIGNEYFNSLLENSLLHDEEGDANGDTEWCKMHHLVHDLAQYVTENHECSILKTSNKIGDISKVRRLRLIFDEDVLIYPKSLEDASKLRTLFGTQEGDSDIDYQKFLSNKQYLRVLDLQWSSIKNLPPSIEMMKHLRYLDLSKTNIEELPEFITSLYNLQTLLLRYCDKLETFPKDMGTLKLLRYLDLSGSCFEVLPESITSLCILRTLKLEDCSNLKELPKDINKLINLRHLILSNHGIWDEMPREMGRLSHLQTLRQFKVGKYNRGATIRELEGLNLLEGELWISNLQNVTNPMDAQGANLNAKRKIRSLMLEWSFRLDHEESTNDVSIFEHLQPNPNLEILKIVCFSDVKFPTWMMSRSISLSLPNLVEIEVRNCYKCEQLPGLGQLPSLRVLVLATMDVVECLDSRFYGDASPAFPSLKKFTLRDFPNLKRWRNATPSPSQPSRWLKSVASSSSSFPCLEKMIVEKCPKLEAKQDLSFIEYFFPSIKDYELDGTKLISNYRPRR